MQRSGKSLREHQSASVLSFLFRLECPVTRVRLVEEPDDAFDESRVVLVSVKNSVGLEVYAEFLSYLHTP